MIINFLRTQDRFTCENTYLFLPPPTPKGHTSWIMELGKAEIRSQKELVSDFSRMLVLQVVSDTSVLNATMADDLT